MSSWRRLPIDSGELMVNVDTPLQVGACAASSVRDIDVPQWGQGVGNT